MTSTIRRICLLLAAAACFVGAIPAFAQTKSPVRMILEPLSIRGRSGSAVPLQIKLEYNSNQLLEGDLVLEVYNSYISQDELIATIRYEGIVLQGNDYFLKTVLPPIEHSNNQLYQIVGWFDTKLGRLSLSRDPEDPAEPHDLLSIGPYERATLICSVSGDRDYVKAKGNRAFLGEALSLANYNPVSPVRSTSDGNYNPQRSAFNQKILNYACGWDAHDLPEDPLYLCSFDVVLLADEALGRLDGVQMKALTTWIAAGGSLCVFPDDNRLTGPHLQFLQTLFERSDDPDLRLSITDDGTLLVISDKQDPIVNRHYGLGRVTLLPDMEDISERLEGAELGTVVGHLWKVRSDSGVFRGESWTAADIRKLMAQRRMKIVQEEDSFIVVPQDQVRPGRGGRRYQSLDQMAMEFNLAYEVQPTGSPLAAACESALMPLGVRMVPASVIALLLVAYVITIGPVDYFVLGYFRARKYTWVLFPFVTAAFTAITVYIAHEYMASSDTGGRMSIIDVVEDGRPVRQTDIQMHFYGSQTTLTEESGSSFMVPGQMIQSTDPYTAQQLPRSLTHDILYSGRFPQTFTTTQAMRQWEPQINRTMTLSPNVTNIPKIPWNDSDLVATADGRLRLNELLKQLPRNAGQVDAVVLHLDQRLSVRGSAGFMFADNTLQIGQEWVNRDIWSRQHQLPPQDAIASIGLLEASARTNTRDYFSIVSQVSPQGSASMEDLPILDPTDADQWLLIVAVKKDLNTTVYRRLYHDVPQKRLVAPKDAEMKVHTGALQDE